MTKKEAIIELIFNKVPFKYDINTNTFYIIDAPAPLKKRLIRTEKLQFKILSDS